MSFKSACFLWCSDANFNFILRKLLRGPLAKAPTSYFLICNCTKTPTCRYVCTACMHKNGTSEAPRTHFRARKSSKFSGGVPQTPSHSLCYGPRILYLPWDPPILSAALPAFFASTKPIFKTDCAN